AGIVAEDVEAADLIADEIADPAHRGGLRQIAGLDMGGAAGGADPAGDLRERHLAAAGQHDRGALDGHGQRGRLADADAATGHPYHFAVEPSHSPLLRGLSGARGYRLAAAPTRVFVSPVLR